MNWQAAVELTVTGLGYDLVDCDRSPRGLLRVFIDHPAPAADSATAAAIATASATASLQAAPASEFITVDDCERVTRQLQHVLEVEAVPYERLEVSSPGLDRPLKKAADYARFSGEQVELSLKVPFNGRKKYSGVLEAGEGEGWRLVFNDGKVDQALDFSLDEVRDARLVPVVDFKGRRFAPPEPTSPEASAQVAGSGIASTAAEDHGGLNQ
ncbi:ribosome maturation factor RimP [soil metagenome]